MNAPAPAPSKLAGAAAPAILRGETERGHACRPEAELPCRCRYALGLSAPPDLTPVLRETWPARLAAPFSSTLCRSRGLFGHAFQFRPYAAVVMICKVTRALASIRNSRPYMSISFSKVEGYYYYKVCLMMRHACNSLVL